MDKFHKISPYLRFKIIKKVSFFNYYILTIPYFKDFLHKKKKNALHSGEYVYNS